MILRLRRAPLPALLALCLALPLTGQAVPTRYDGTFRKYSKRYFGVAFDWRWFKAQGMTESGLDPAARSGVGARGVMQLMPTTFEELRRVHPGLNSVDDPEWNIAAGILYDRQLWRLWAEDSVRAEDQADFMFASYNAGRIPLLRAQALARRQLLDHRDWHIIVSVAPTVPRWRHRETLNYVSRIAGNLGRMDDEGRVVRAGVAPDTVLVEAPRP